MVIPAGREGLACQCLCCCRLGCSGGGQLWQRRTHDGVGCCRAEAWEACWCGLEFKRQGSGLTKILSSFFSPLTYHRLRGQNSIESTAEDGLVYGNIVFGYKQLCLEVNSLRIMGSD